MGRTTTQLRSPTTYGATSSDTYHGWNIDLDNADGDSDRTTGKDDPWDFGATNAYPTLIYHLTDYDTDEDGYIEISGHAQLNAVRYDLNGDGVVAATDTANYNAAFPNRVTSSTKRMGCPSGTCVGYELTANVDLDTNGDGNHTAADAYYNSGNGWDPLGDDSGNRNQYSGNFKGNGFTIDNLVINRTSTDDVGLFGANSSASTIETLGVINANVTAREYVGILVGTSYGPIVACYTTGAVSGSRSDVGGLVGLMNASNASVSSSYSTASVGGAANNAGGLIGRAISSSITNSYSTGMRQRQRQQHRRVNRACQQRNRNRKLLGHHNQRPLQQRSRNGLRHRRPPAAPPTTPPVAYTPTGTPTSTDRRATTTRGTSATPDSTRR